MIRVYISSWFIISFIEQAKGYIHSHCWELVFYLVVESYFR